MKWLLVFVSLVTESMGATGPRKELTMEMKSFGSADLCIAAGTAEGAKLGWTEFEFVCVPLYPDAVVPTTPELR